MAEGDALYLARAYRLMPRRRRKKTPWVPEGLPYIGREMKSHDRYHIDANQSMGQFDQMPEEHKAIVREKGMAALKHHLVEQRHAKMEAERRQRVLEQELWRQGK